MTQDDIEVVVTKALEMLVRNDQHLLHYDVNERSISHRLACHLEPFFSDWDVDCEYNRNHDDPKRLNIESRHTSDNDLEAITVYPDIIVHKRNTDDNLLVIEMKKTSSQEDDDYDLRKLDAFKRQLGYHYCLFVKVETGVRQPSYKIHWC